MSSDADLKSTRMVYYEDDIHELEVVLDRLLDLSGAKKAMFIDIEGHLVTSRGSGAADLDNESISALVAGTFAATKETAKLLGEEEFSVLFHQGATDSIQLSLIEDRLLLGIIFDDSTTIGMVRLYASETTKKVASILENMHEDSTSKSSVVEDDYSDSVEESLDNLFE